MHFCLDLLQHLDSANTAKLELFISINLNQKKKKKRMLKSRSIDRKAFHCQTTRF